MAASHQYCMWPVVSGPETTVVWAHGPGTETSCDQTSARTKGSDAPTQIHLQQPEEHRPAGYGRHTKAGLHGVAPPLLAVLYTPQMTTAHLQSQLTRSNGQIRFNNALHLLWQMWRNCILLYIPGGSLPPCHAPHKFRNQVSNSASAPSRAAWLQQLHFCHECL